MLFITRANIDFINGYEFRFCRAILRYEIRMIILCSSAKISKKSVLGRNWDIPNNVYVMTNTIRQFKCGRSNDPDPHWFGFPWIRFSPKYHWKLTKKVFFSNPFHQLQLFNKIFLLYLLLSKMKQDSLLFLRLKERK